MYGVLRNDNTAQAWLISIDPYIHTPHLLLLAPTPTTTPTTHQPTPMRFPRPLWPLCFFLSTTPRSPWACPGPLYASGCLLFRVCCVVCMWNGVFGPPTSARLLSVGRAGPCVSFPKFPGTFVFGCRLRRACASGVGKLQITNYKLHSQFE